MKWIAVLLAVLGASAAARAETVKLEPFVLGIPEVTKIANAGDGTGRLFFATQAGVIRVHDNGALLPEPFLDITPLVRSGLEDGLLGLAFHPDFESNRFFYVFYSKREDGNSVVVRYRASASNPNVADPASALLLLEVVAPIAVHNGGELVFGPDGLLYISTGENDESAKAQNLGSLLGKILRIDVNAGTPYGIPPGNPFVGVPGARPEIIAYGLRNPYRMTFDRATGDLLIADNGVIDCEIDVIPPGTFGQNFGWPIMEADHCFLNAGCSTAGLTLPILPLPGSGAVVGGYRYRAGRIPLLQGIYVFGFFSSGGALRGARPGANGVWSAFPLVATNLSFLDSVYGEDESGDLLVANYSAGAEAGIYRIVASNTPSTATLPNVMPFPVEEGEPLQWTVKLSSVHLAGPVKVGYRTEDITAMAGQDYVPASGTLTFQPGTASLPITVQTVSDGLNEVHEETFRIRLVDPDGVVLGVAESIGTIRSLDPEPRLTFDECSVTEGDAGSAPCTIHFSLAGPSGRDVVVSYATFPLTAGAGDYGDVSGQLTLAPGATNGTFSVPVLGDTLVEDNETVGISISAFPALVIGAPTKGFILDDDARLPAGVEAAHGAALRGDLSAGNPFFRVAQAPRSSYEVVVDEVSGDAGDVTLQLLAADGSTVLQSATPAAGLSSVRMRWRNTSDAAPTNQVVRMGATCPSGCGPDDVYRLRLYDTTLRGARFNNGSGQLTVLILQNTEDRPVQATVSFWRSDGARLLDVPLTLASRSSVVRDTSLIYGIQFQAGSITVAHDGGYGALVGKAVSLEPGSGLSFDTPLEPRPR